MKKVILFFLLAFQLNTSFGQEWCDSTIMACDSVFLDSIWFTHHPQNGDRLQVRIRTEHDFLHGPTFIICPAEDSIQFLDDSYSFFGIVGPSYAQLYYEFEEFNFTEETITGDIILNNAGPAFYFSKCVLPFSVNVSDSTTTVDEVFHNNEIEVFPNPADHQLNIKMKNNNMEIVGFQLFDITGKRQHIVVENHTIDLRAVPSGFYFLQVNLDNGKSVVKKLFRQ